MAAHQGVFFTIPHFDGYNAVLIKLPEVSVPDLREAMLDAWRATAPARLTSQKGLA